MTDRIHPAAIDATGYVGDGAQYLADDGTWKIPAGGGGGGAGALSVCIAANAAGTSVPNVTATLIPLAVEEYDSGGMHDTATNNSRITIPADGVYVVNAQVGFSYTGTGRRILLLFKNGAQVNSAVNGQPAGSGSVYLPVTLALVAGDYLEMKGYQDSGSSLTATGRLSVVQMA